MQCADVVSSAAIGRARFSSFGADAARSAAAALLDARDAGEMLAAAPAA